MAAQKERQIEEEHLLPDHVHMLIDIPPKYSVAHVGGYIKGKSALYSARTFLGHRLQYGGQHFCARGYCVSPIGRDDSRLYQKARRTRQKAGSMESV